MKVAKSIAALTMQIIDSSFIVEENYSCNKGVVTFSQFLSLSLVVSLFLTLFCFTFICLPF